MEAGAFCLFSFPGFCLDRMFKLKGGTRVTKPEFGLYVASTTAATTILRSLTGALIPLAGDKGMELWDTDGDTR
jgi:hypothetical protein